MKLITRLLVVLVAIGTVYLGSPGRAEAAGTVPCKTASGTTVGYATSQLGCFSMLSSYARSGNPVGHEDFQAMLDFLLGANNATSTLFDKSTGSITFNIASLDMKNLTSFQSVLAGFSADYNVTNTGTTYVMMMKTSTNNPGSTPVPEPSTIFLLAAGLAGLAGFGYRRRNTASKN